jgi:hypothetical protein
MYQTIACARRLSLALILAFFKDNPDLQVILMIYSTIGFVAYITSIRPFEIKVLNYLEVFNELIILSCLYHMLIFTGAFTTDKETLYTVGWSMDIVLVIHFLVNMCMIAYQFF